MAAEVTMQQGREEPDDVMKTEDVPKTTDSSKETESITKDQEVSENKPQSGSSSKRHNKNNRNDKKRDNHHHRRKPSKKKRKWKPYSKMTWEEKKAVEERETLRADRIRGEMLDRGRPVAPYNTTQFLMAEHDPYEEDSVLDSGYKGNDSSNQGLNDEDMDESIEAEYNDSPHMAPEFISQDFSEAYERVQEESLSIMTRDDLVKEHLSLERNLSYLQGKLAEEKSINNSFSIRVENLEEELERLRKDNERLVRENMRLVYGNDAPDNAESSVYQTSDYEYEVPTSDQDAVKYSEDYNDVREQSADSRCRFDGVNQRDGLRNDEPNSCPSDSSCNSTNTLEVLCSLNRMKPSNNSGDNQTNNEGTLCKKDAENNSNDPIQLEKSRQLSSSPQKREPESDDSALASSETCLACYPEDSKSKSSSSSCFSEASYPCDLNIPETNLQDPIISESFRSSSEVDQKSSKFDQRSDNDVIMQSLKCEESMDAASFPAEEKSLL